MCTTRYSSMIRPLTAMTAFLPIGRAPQQPGRGRPRGLRLLGAGAVPSRRRHGPTVGSAPAISPRHDTADFDRHSLCRLCWRYAAPAAPRTSPPSPTTRHFTRAAERVHVAQPSLSQQIRALERELGAELFHRARGHISLTDAGEALLPLARRILADAETARREVQEVAQLRARPGAARGAAEPVRRAWCPTCCGPSTTATPASSCWSHEDGSQDLVRDPGRGRARPGAGHHAAAEPGPGADDHRAAARGTGRRLLAGRPRPRCAAPASGSRTCATGRW